MMNGRHLPSGQNMHPHGQQPQHDVNNNMRSRQNRPYNQHHNHSQHQVPYSHNQHPAFNQQQYQQNNQLYNNHNGYMNPYANNYYPQQQIPHPQQYHQYPVLPQNNIYAYQQQHYGRSPPSHYQPYTHPPPVVSSSAAALPSRPNHVQSPVIVSSPYTQPPSNAPTSLHEDHNESRSNSASIHSSAPTPISTTKVDPAVASPANADQAEANVEQVDTAQAEMNYADTPQADVMGLEAIETATQSAVPSPTMTPKPAFLPPLPWYSHSAESWPIRTRRRRRRKHVESEEQAVELPTMQSRNLEEQIDSETTASIEKPSAPTKEAHAQDITIVQEMDQEQDAKSTSPPASEDASSTTPTTPASAQQALTSTTNVVTTAEPTPKPAKKVVAVPVLPVLPKMTARPASASTPTITATAQEAEPTSEIRPPMKADPKVDTKADEAQEVPVEQETAQTPTPASGPPPSWASLLKSKTIATQNGIKALTPSTDTTGSKPAQTKQESLASALQTFDAKVTDSILPFLKPRGLVNTGNMCYMNSVLQVLLFCSPFYDFLDQAAKRAAHSFKSDTPVIDAMIFFMREFPTITSADSVEKLRRQLRSDDMEKYGEPFIPEYVYDVINRLPQFSSMRRGHQQDAEEFLGFLLSALHDECAKVMKASGSTATSNQTTHTPGSPASEAAGLAGEASNGWQEVGPKQRASTTQSSGISVETPITKIFGGMLRSELKVQGQKLSVTMEPYQPLQLDIDSPTINNVIDALKALTRPEAIAGDFSGARPGTQATKQLLIETLPPVLIIQLKRFRFANNTPFKVGKKVGYPLELELPKEIFSRQKQTAMINTGGLPKYRLLSVVYHHGKNATGGHYTVDVRRQDGTEWIRMDDTAIRRIRAEDVAEGGAEEDPKVLAKALADHKKDTVSTSNIFDQIKDEDDGEDSGADEWKQVNGVGRDQKKWSAVANGSGAPKKNKERDLNLKDNKVAYLLFYQRI